MPEISSSASGRLIILGLAKSYASVFENVFFLPAPYNLKETVEQAL
jgi:hypothetical protein